MRSKVRIQAAGLRLGHDEIEIRPCRSHQASRTLAVDCAEIDRLGRLALLLGDILRRLVRSFRRRTSLMQIVTALEGCGHRRLRAEIWAAARISIRLKSAPIRTLPGAGTNSARKRAIARDLLQVRLRAGYPSGDCAGDPIVRVNAAGDRRNPRRQSDVKG